MRRTMFDDDMDGVATVMTEMKVDDQAGGAKSVSGDDASDNEYNGIRGCGNEINGSGNGHHHDEGKDDGNGGEVTSRKGLNG